MGVACWAIYCPVFQVIKLHTLQHPFYPTILHFAVQPISVAFGLCLWFCAQYSTLALLQNLIFWALLLHILNHWRASLAHTRRTWY